MAMEASAEARSHNASAVFKSFTTSAAKALTASTAFNPAGSRSLWPLGSPKVPEPPTAQSRLVEELRNAKNRRLVAGQVQGVKEDDTVPLTAFGSAICPLEYVCCGISANQLPCRDSHIFQGAFGNAADLATSYSQGKVTHTTDTQTLAAGGLVGFPTLEEAGWDWAPEPDFLKSAVIEEEEREHFYAACACFGFRFVKKVGEESGVKMLISFRKDEMPGSAAEVKERVKKLQAIDHVNIIRLILACEDQKEIHLIYEAQDGAGYLPMKVLTRQEPLTESEVAKVLQQLAAGLAACHRINIHHLDWSFWNLMSGSYGSVFPIKLFGIGLAGVLHSGRTARVPEPAWLMRGAFYCMPPELCRIRIDSDLAFAYKKLDPALKGPCDIWSLGVVAYMAAAGHAPFGGADELTVIRRILDDTLSIEQTLGHLERLCIELLERAMWKNPKGRPRAEAIITNNWVVQHVRAAEDRKEVAKVLARMRAFASLEPVMRTIGQVLLQTVRVDKLRNLEAMFHALDIQGDGELEPHELAAFCAGRATEVRDLFKVLDLNGSSGISMSEFVLANIFGEEVLTERMLLRAFNYLDLDGGGEITASELYTALQKISTEITPAQVADFMGDVDRDWDTEINFEEFKGFFPTVKSQSHLIEERVQKSETLQDVTERTFEKFADDCARWRALMSEELRKANALCEIIAKDEHLEKVKTWARDVQSLLKRSMNNVRSTPTLMLPEGPEVDALRHERKDIQRALAKGKRGPLTAAELLAVKGGVFGMDVYFATRRSKWVEAVAHYTNAAQMAMKASSKNRRRQDSVAVLEDLSALLEKAIEGCEAFCVEQEYLLEASQREAAVPKLPFARRGVTNGIREVSTTRAEIEKFRKEREAALAAERRQKEEKEAQERMLEELGIERRGLAWLQRQAAKAEKKGLQPPPGIASMQAFLRPTDAPSVGAYQSGGRGGFLTLLGGHPVASAIAQAWPPFVASCATV